MAPGPLEAVRDSQATREARGLRRDLRDSQAREAALVDSIKIAIDVLDDMGINAYDREQRAAATLEAAIGRPPRRELET